MDPLALRAEDRQRLGRAVDGAEPVRHGRRLGVSRFTYEPLTVPLFDEFLRRQ